jgi:hypothetical protein
MRPTGLGSGFYKDDVDYSVFCDEWCIGRIYEKRSSPEHLRWFWSLFCPSKPESLRISNQVATLEIAKAGLRRVGINGRRGRGWRSPRRSRDYANLMVPVSEPPPTN